jgi:hypothetical protein
MMKTSLRTVSSQGVVYQALAFVCPGCAEGGGGGSGLHILPVNSTEKSPSWDWDGNLESPTLSPSILTRTAPYSETGEPLGVCHSFLTNGVFTFLGDCTHSLAGQLVPMGDLPDWEMFEDGKETDG